MSEENNTPKNFKDPVSDRKEDHQKVWDSVQNLRAFLNKDPKEIQELYDGLLSHNLGSGEDIERYNEITQEAYSIAWEDGFLNGALNREGAEWVQSVPFEGATLGASAVNVRAAGDGLISGSTAVSMASRRLNKGTPVHVPLWRSGIWVTLKTPTTNEFLALDRQLANSKVTLGRETFGHIFSNEMVYSISILFDFVVDHITSTNIKSTHRSVLKKLILSTDLMQLMNYLAVSIYPKGYPLEQACVARVQTCNHVNEKMANLSYLSWTDKSRLTDKQLAHMADRRTQYSEKEILAYQSEHSDGHRMTVELGDGITLVLKEPSIERYITAGDRWVSDISATAARIYGENISTSERNQFIQTQAKITAGRRWSHWVDQITIANDEGASLEEDPVGAKDSIVTDEPTIAEIVGNLISMDTDLRDKYEKGVFKMIEDSTITVIGIPKYDCPGCGEKAITHPTRPDLIPLNPVSTFLHLMGQRLTIATR